RPFEGRVRSRNQTDARSGAAGLRPPKVGAGPQFTRTRDHRRRRYAPLVRAPIPLQAEILAARAVGSLSRLAGAGGGTTLPGKLLWRLDPSAVDRLAARLPRGSALVSATNGKTT